MNANPDKQPQPDPKITITPEVKLLINETVESRLEKLPASTYKLIEKMVEERVAKTEKFYHRLAIVAVAALGFIGWAFFNATARNASEKASDAIVKSALGEKLKQVADAHTQIMNTKSQVTTAGAETLDLETKLTAKLKELENQDNIVRYSGRGILVVDGEIRLRRKNPDREVMLYLDKTDGRFKITDFADTFDPLNGSWLEVDK